MNFFKTKILFLTASICFFVACGDDSSSSTEVVEKITEEDLCADKYGYEIENTKWYSNYDETSFLKEDIENKARSVMFAYSPNMEVRSIEYDEDEDSYKILVMDMGNSPSAHNHYVYADIEGCSYRFSENGEMSSFLKEQPGVELSSCVCKEKKEKFLYLNIRKASDEPKSSSSEKVKSSSSSKIKSSSSSAKSSSSEKESSSSVVESSSSEILFVVEPLYGCDTLNCVNMYFLNADFLEDELYGVYVDERDQQAYRTVQIGNDVWLAQNLNYQVEGSRCYNDDSVMCETYGRLYDWKTAMDDLCPAGWRLPSREDFQNLIDSVENDLDLLSEEFIDGLNQSGFSAAPAGEYYQGFIDNGQSATYWSCDSYTSDMAYYWFYNERKSMTVARIDDGGDKTGFKSVRCIKE